MLATPKITLEDAVRWTSALLHRPTRGQVQDSIKHISGAFKTSEIRAMVSRLGEEGVLNLENGVSFRSSIDLHQSTLDLSRHKPELLQHQVRQGHWNAENHARRLKIYLDWPLGDDEFIAYQACDYWLPIWDPDFFFSRCLQNQAKMLRSLRPGLWFQGIWDPRFELLFDQLESSLVQEFCLELALARGDLGRADKLLDAGTKRKGYDGVVNFLRGKTTLAHEKFAKLISRRKEGQPALEPLVAVFACLTALRMNDLEMLSDTRLSTHNRKLDGFFKALCRYLRKGEAAFPTWESPGAGLEWCTLWSLRDCLPSQLQPRPECTDRLRRAGLHGWLEQLETPTYSWGAGVVRKEVWRTWLEGVQKKGQAGKPEQASESGHLVWDLDSYGLTAHFQGTRASTEVPLHTLIRKPPDYLSEWDHKVIARIERQQWNQEVIILKVTEAVRALIGHPHVIHKGQPVRLLETHQKLHLQRTAGGYKVDLKPAFGKGAPYRLKLQAGGVLEVCFASRWDAVLQPLLDEGHEIPLGAEEEMRQCLGPWLDKFDIDYGKGVRPLAEVVRQGELVARLLPQKSGLRLSWVWKLPDQGPAFALLQGPTREALHWNGRLLQVERNFAQERLALETLLSQHPALPAEETLYGELEEALDMLRLLQSAAVACEWPDGKVWKARDRVARHAFLGRVSSESDWFDVQGELRVDETLVLELGRTLQLLREFPGRYLRLGDDDYAEISQDLRLQLQALGDLVEEHREGLRVSPLAVPSLAQLDLQLETDKQFRDCLERFASLTDYRPKLPVTLEADLRDYQREGFEWLAQRAEAQVGACLADDMGLGKTLQVLALMLHTRQHGPHLVVCPTSVVANWRDQMIRFAPGLRPRLYEGKDRGDVLRDMQLGDVIIASYRILLQDQAVLAGVEWNVALLDEAQFIKNPDSKTARASYALKARHRVATSGTPIENRLSELWSIFRYLNPSLLGSLASFRKRFETNMAVTLNASQRRLKRLVAPFLLRRTKSQVLSELPPRTEIALAVELSAQERALYEQLRRQAEEGLQKQGQRFELLAHLTRMRQACCHPRLILDQPGLTSSKLRVFLELFEDLRAGRHRCLVFSQFTRLLDLLESQLREQKVDYLRLDGSTPAVERRLRVEAFQEGQGDLFLISLKAGGTGLNLTAADYVVHLDPWWNPAVEDQASDRAHRIGQLRPVTIYRLIASDTLEEKVVRLHGHKRKLAHDLLEGRETAVGLSDQDLRQLLSSD
ncbi:DEAD/DEAH box helicase [bacterium]|nr:DEAD/DEAH box helicase [bacterium]